MPTNFLHRSNEDSFLWMDVQTKHGTYHFPLQHFVDPTFDIIKISYFLSISIFYGSPCCVSSPNPDKRRRKKEKYGIFIRNLNGKTYIWWIWGSN